MNRLQHVFTFRPGDQEKLAEYHSALRRKSNQDLVKAYNREADIGIVGNHQQALYIVGLHRVFFERFGESPVEIIDNRIIRLKGIIEERSNSIHYTEIFSYEN